MSRVVKRHYDARVIEDRMRYYFVVRIVPFELRRLRHLEGHPAFAETLLRNVRKGRIILSEADAAKVYRQATRGFEFAQSVPAGSLHAKLFALLELIYDFVPHSYLYGR